MLNILIVGMMDVKGGIEQLSFSSSAAWTRARFTAIFYATAANAPMKKSSWLPAAASIMSRGAAKIRSGAGGS